MALTISQRNARMEELATRIVRDKAELLVHIGVTERQRKVVDARQLELATEEEGETPPIPLQECLLSIEGKWIAPYLRGGGMQVIEGEVRPLYWVQDTRAFFKKVKRHPDFLYVNFDDIQFHQKVPTDR